ncbi:SPOR domain-containing protein [Salibaculum halophilum]|uniref:SPOR domain-containing protein n=1 Tax=Salibaculum halophilum TaxID=1914408 RepID=UPI000A122148|nr:SPOR domain-containing protein [Salibaculum halophilum]
MTGTPGRHTRTALFAGAALLALTGCDGDGGFDFGAGTSPGAQPPQENAADGQSVQLVERDVEAPEVFQVTEEGLWDGRPSLGGVWVAHPEVDAPERVIIRNQENDSFVIGALFRRERENPGPRLQVSSDAAAALEMLAGNPAELQVTALRREEAAAPDPSPTADFDTPENIAAAPLDVDAPGDETETDPIAGAAAAIEAADASDAPSTAAPDPAPDPAGGLEKPYVQIGIFSIEANATRTADRLRGNGIVPTVLEQESQGRTFWRVIVGPATSAEDRAAIREQVRGMGFSDAYFVTN